MCLHPSLFEQELEPDDPPANYDIDPTHFEGEDPLLNENNVDIGMEDET